MPEPELLFLTNRHKVHHVGHGTNRAQVFNVSAGLKDRLKVGCAVKVIFNGALMFARDKDHPLNPRGDRLLNGVLNDGTVYDGEELFRHRLGCGQEASSPSGDGKDCGANLHQLLRAALRTRIAVVRWCALTREPNARRHGAVRRRAGG